MGKVKIIAVVNRKGGTSKTTSCGYLSACLHAAGRRVVGYDMDPDISWLGWWNKGVLPYEVRETTFRKFSREIEEGSEITDLDFVVIDTPPNNADIIYDVAEIADEVIVPLSPTHFDSNRLLRTLESVARVESKRSKPLASVLLTRYDGRLNISKGVTKILEEKDIPLLDSRVRNLTAYTSFSEPTYLEEYDRVLKELEVI